MSEAGQFAFFLAMGGGFLALLLGPVGAALGRRLMPKDDPEGRVAELEARVGELEGQLQVMQELSERVDFAERLLAQQHDAGGLPRGAALREGGAG